MRITKIIYFLGILLLSTSCVKRQSLIPVDRSVSEYRNFPGLLQYQLPQGDNWYVIKERNYTAIYGKKLESSQHSFIVSLSTSKTNNKFSTKAEFLSFLKNIRSKDVDSNKFSNMKYSEELDGKHGEYCSKFTQKAVEKGKGELEINGYTCLHPIHKELLFTILYTERTNTNKANLKIQNEGIAFIESLNLNKYNKEVK